MRIELADIQCMPTTAWRPVYRAKALVIEGDNQVIEDLEDWRKNSARDFKRIMALLRLVVENREPVRNQHVKSDKAGSGIYEISLEGN